MNLEKRRSHRIVRDARHDEKGEGGGMKDADSALIPSNHDFRILTGHLRRNLCYNDHRIVNSVTSDNCVSPCDFI
jgi:hypothetical protein